MQMIQSCESRHLPLSPPHPRVGVQGFAHRTWDFDFSMTFGWQNRAVAGLCWAPSSAKDGFSFSLSLASGCSEVSGFFGSEGTLQDSRQRFAPVAASAIDSWEATTSDLTQQLVMQWWDVMRCDEMWWGMPGLLDFLILFVALECFRSGVTSDFGVSIWSIWVGHLPMFTGLPKLRWPLGLLGLGSRFVGRRPTAIAGGTLPERGRWNWWNMKMFSVNHCHILSLLSSFFRWPFLSVSFLARKRSWETLM